MFPVLFDSYAVNFSNNGIGVLSDVITCEVVEELNTSFELEMQYPITGIHCSKIYETCWIKAKSNPYCETPQLFRIYKISKPINGVITIWAEHTTYAADRYVCFPNIEYEDSEGGVNTMISYLNASVRANVPGFTFRSELTDGSVYKWSVPTPTTLKAVRNKLTSMWGGDWEFTNAGATLLDRRGNDRGVRVSYGENIQSATMERDTSGQYTCICAFWKGVDPDADPDIKDDKDKQIIVYTEPLFKPIYANVGVSDTYFKPYILDCSSEFSEKPEPSELDKCISKFVRANLDIGHSANRCTVKVVPRGHTVEYAHLTNIDHIELGDTITVDLGHGEPEVKQRCIKTVYDVVHDRYTSIDLGVKKRSIASTTSANEVKSNTKVDVSSITAKKNSDKNIVNITIAYTNDTSTSFSCSYDSNKQLVSFGAVPIKYE